MDAAHLARNQVPELQIRPMEREAKDEMNPLCACGCGRETRLPTSKIIMGHGKRKLTEAQTEELLRLVDSGMSHRKAAAAFGITQGWASELIWRMRNRGAAYVETGHHQIEVVRKSEVEQIKRRAEWWHARKELNKLRSYLKNRNRSQSRRSA